MENLADDTPKAQREAAESHEGDDLMRGGQQEITGGREASDANLKGIEQEDATLPDGLQQAFQVERCAVC
jgi:hypothetical protein